MQIRWIDADGRKHSGSLFAVFAALSRREVASFPAVRPHQREPWHCFCVQAAAMALIHAGATELPENEADWRSLLLDLTPEWPDGEAWELVVDDWMKPALLQPPMASPANRADYKTRSETPDALDMLVTSKNHDLKRSRMIAADDEDWLFALVTLQTIEGFMGAGNFGISRMNGGFGSRMSLGIRPAGGAGQSFARDVTRLTEGRPPPSNGLGLLWLEPWDGTRQLDFAALDPLYIDVCRRIRLEHAVPGIVARAAGSRVARVAAAALQGKTGDPWAPELADRSKSVTPTAAGFGYRQMARLMNRKEVAPPPLARLAAADASEGLAIVATAVVRGQGRTEGFHHRAIPISKKITARRGSREMALDRAGGVAETRAHDAAAAGRILRRALIALCQSGPDRPRLDDDSAGKKVDRWIAAYDREVDAVFFDEAFWAVVAEEAGAHRKAWRKRLDGIARRVFERGARAAPRTDMRRIRARARAENMLEAALKKFLKEVADDE